MNKAKRRAVIAGNWKMNKNRAEARALITELLPLVKDADCEVVLCTPYTNLETALADAYYAACVLYPEQFADIDPEAKAGEIFTELLGSNPYPDLKEAGYAFRAITLGE